MLVILTAVVTMIAKLYRKASANMAFVRTGMGGVRVIRDAPRAATAEAVA